MATKSVIVHCKKIRFASILLLVLGAGCENSGKIGLLRCEVRELFPKVGEIMVAEPVIGAPGSQPFDKIATCPSLVFQSESRKVYCGVKFQNVYIYMVNGIVDNFTRQDLCLGLVNESQNIISIDVDKMFLVTSVPSWRWKGKNTKSRIASLSGLEQYDTKTGAIRALYSDGTRNDDKFEEAPVLKLIDGKVVGVCVRPQEAVVFSLIYHSRAFGEFDELNSSTSMVFPLQIVRDSIAEVYNVELVLSTQRETVQ